MTTIPESAREELRKAAQTPADKGPQAREIAIDQAIDRLRKLYPTHFKPEDDHDQDHRGK